MKILDKLPRQVLKPAPPSPYHVTASVTAFRHFILAESKLCYSSSHWHRDGLSVFLPTDAGDADMGDAAWAVLRASRFIRPGEPGSEEMEMPRDKIMPLRREYINLLRAKAGVKTLKALYEGAKYVTLWRKDGQIRVEAWARHGFDGWTGLKGEVADVYPETIGEAAFGAAVRKALARAVG